MRQPYLVAGALLVGLCFGVGAVSAQEEPGRLPSSALGTTGALSDKDGKTVGDYIDYWIKQLLSGDPERVATARGRLIEPYNQGATESFVGAYDQILAGRIGEGLQAKDVSGRMNTMIVTRSIRHAKVADVLKAGLKDEIDAVVYQSAVAAEAITGNKVVEMAVKLGLRGPVVDALKKEKNGWILEPLYLASSNIPDFAAWEAALAKMNERLALHVAKPGMFDCDAAGLRAIQVAIITAKSQEASGGPAVPAKLIQQMTLVSIRYMEWAVWQPNGFTDAALKNLIVTSESGAKWGFNTSGITTLPPSVAGAKNADEQKLFVPDWKKPLKSDPFKLKDEDINLPKPPAK
jgi:hypothetical protein